MTQAEMFAQDAKRRAVDKVEANADARWLDQALNAVRICAASRETFTTDDIWQALASIAPLVGKGPHERRAMGAVMRQAQRRKIARPLNSVKASASTVNHARPLRVWAAW